jgi:hypothetical protein
VDGLWTDSRIRGPDLSNSWISGFRSSRPRPIFPLVQRGSDQLAGPLGACIELHDGCLHQSWWGTNRGRSSSGRFDSRRRLACRVSSFSGGGLFPRSGCSRGQVADERRPRRRRPPRWPRPPVPRALSSPVNTVRARTALGQRNGPIGTRAGTISNRLAGTLHAECADACVPPSLRTDTRCGGVHPKPRIPPF